MPLQVASASSHVMLYKIGTLFHPPQKIIIGPFLAFEKESSGRLPEIFVRHSGNNKFGLNVKMVERGSLLSSSSIETREDETPRNSMDFYDRLVTWIPPASPSAARKTRSRAARMIPRTDSLRESKVSILI